MDSRLKWHCFVLVLVFFFPPLQTSPWKMKLTVTFWLSDNFMDEGAVLMNVFNSIDISSEGGGGGVCSVNDCNTCTLTQHLSAEAVAAVFLCMSRCLLWHMRLCCWFAPVTMATVETNYHLKSSWVSHWTVMRASGEKTTLASNRLALSPPTTIAASCWDECHIWRWLQCIVNITVLLQQAGCVDVSWPAEGLVGQRQDCVVMTHEHMAVLSSFAFPECHLAVRRRGIHSELQTPLSTRADST